MAIQSGNLPQASSLVQELSQPLYRAKGWLKFLGILTIISGIPSLLALVGIIQIWMGVLLFQAGSSIDSAGRMGDRFAFLGSMNGLKTYFIIQGVLALIGLLFAFATICILIVLPLLGVSLLPWQNILNNLPSNLPTY